MPWSGLPAFFLGLTEAKKTQEVGVLDVQVTCEPEYLVHFPELTKKKKKKNHTQAGKQKDIFKSHKGALKVFTSLIQGE